MNAVSASTTMNTATAATGTTPQATLITSALIQNNEGVALLSSGKPQEAIAYIKRSLAMLNQSLITPMEESKASPSEVFDLYMLSTVPFLSSNEDDCRQGDELRLFDGALALALSAGGPRPEDVAFYSAAGMLNLAVAVHQVAKMASWSSFPQDQARANALYQKADRLYRSAQQVLEVSLQHQQGQPHATKHMFRFLFVAAQNNRLVIALEVGNISGEQLKKEMDAMLKVLSRDGGCPPQEQAFLDEFFLNTALLDMTCMLKALAAPCA
ncbi:expressed unknown protein [Seminavis robusta]|uniref:Uncharacterized protein n=1 Tax=Seminavis robusta TaxID=568900 RepID=A0A9N8E3J9_9STRA|nr:expressed unknown protein [Seminavis robusta]|eukprot:Sro582_g170410.1 n/a (269) ;mRNA; f:4149-4955